MLLKLGTCLAVKMGAAAAGGAIVTAAGLTLAGGVLACALARRARDRRADNGVDETAAPAGDTAA